MSRKRGLLEPEIEKRAKIEKKELLLPSFTG